MTDENVCLRKIVKRVGDSIGFIINKEERIIYDINPGDIIELTIKKVR